MNQLPSYSPGLMSLIPLFYVGWADSLLSPSEAKLINQKINELPFLSASDKKLLESWSDPASPPSSKQFRQWVRLIQKRASDLPDDSRQSLAGLGIQMAKNSTHEKGELIYWTNPETREALEGLEKILGISSLENYRNIFTPQQRRTEIIQVVEMPGFEISAMTRLLDDDYHELRSKIRTLMSDATFQYQIIRDKKAYREKVLEWCKLLADQGLGILSFPKANGGKDDMGSYCTVFEMLGYHDLSLAIKFGVQFGLFGGSVLWLGTESHHEKYLEKIGKMELPGCFAMTETGHGSNVRGLETTITFDPITNELVINTPHEKAGKEYIGNALHGRMATVFGQLIVHEKNEGIHAVLVPLRNEQHQLYKGIRVEDCGYKMGLNGVDNGRIWFDQVRVPKQNLLDHFGQINEQGIYTSSIENESKRFFTMLGTLVGGRVCVPLAGLSATKTGLTIAVLYALKRRQFAPNEDEPETLLLDYPSHQRRLMPLLAKTYALDFALSWLAKRYVNRTGIDMREIETLAAALKAYSTSFTTEVLQECREACGGKGYLSENRFDRLKNDTDVFTTFEGDNTVLMQLVAKGLLSALQKEFHDEGFRAVMRQIFGQISTSVSELNPFVIRNTDAEHLLGEEFQLSAFRYREHKNLLSISQRMRSLLKKRMDPYDAFLRCQNHLLVLAEAFAERIILEKFVEAIQKCENENLRKALKMLCDLFALSTIEKHKGWYLEQEYMTGAKTKAIRKTVDKLCKDVRNEAQPLVEAFAIPAACLAAPIAFNAGEE